MESSVVNCGFQDRNLLRLLSWSEICDKKSEYYRNIRFFSGGIIRDVIASSSQSVQGSALDPRCEFVCDGLESLFPHALNL